MVLRNVVLWVFCTSLAFLWVCAARAYDPLLDAMHKSSAGMQVQSERLKVVAENLANADTLANSPGGMPYRRKTIIFGNSYDRHSKMTKVRVKRVDLDKSAFIPKYDPYHPLANDQGYVLLPNVNRLIENMDTKEAELQYQANLNALDVSRSMRRMTLDMLQKQ